VKLCVYNKNNTDDVSRPNGDDDEDYLSLECDAV
jgi:hypothetical protein